MIATQLSAELEQCAGGFLAAAQFAADAGHLRAASLVGAAARVARAHGAAGVEGYLAAIADLIRYSLRATGRTSGGRANSRSGG